MHLYFLRHGVAEDESSSGRDDDRQLTDEGRAKCRDAAAGLATLEPAFTIVWTSPLVRARETAELVAPGHEAEVREELANGPVNDLLRALLAVPEDAAVLLVGHEPQFSTAVATLLGVQNGRGGIQMKKAGLAHVEVDLRGWPRTGALLHGLLTPKQLRHLGQEPIHR